MTSQISAVEVIRPRQALVTGALVSSERMIANFRVAVSTKLDKSEGTIEFHFFRSKKAAATCAFENSFNTGIVQINLQAGSYLCLKSQIEDI